MVERHRTYEADVYGQVQQTAKDGGADDGWIPQSQDIAARTAGTYSMIEEDHLKKNQAAMRGDAPAPDADYLAYTHAQLHDMVNNDLDVGTIDARGQVANDMGNWLGEVHDQAVKASQSEQASWQGQAAGRAHGFVHSTATWADGAANASWLASNRYSQQAAAAQTAKNAMPPPSDFNQAAEMDKARQQMQNGDLIGGLRAQQDIAAKQTAAQQAHEQAAQVMHTMDATYYSTATTQPSISPPPDLSGRSPDEHTKVSGFTAPPAGPGGSGPYSGGGPVPGPGAGSAGGVAGGPPGGGYLPPDTSGPGQSSGSAQLAGQASGNTSGGVPGNVPRSGASGAPIAGALGGQLGGGGDITRNPNGRGGSPRTNFAGGRVSGGGYVPKEGAAGGRLGESEGKVPGKGSGAGAAGAKEGAVGRGGAAASAKAGAAGQPGAGVGGGKGKKEDDEHKRKYGETEGHFDVKLTEGPDGEKVVPPVIGER